jgi:uncharacterized membrane protein
MRLAPRSLRTMAIAVAVIAYALLAHFSNSVPGNESLGAILAIAPLWFAAVFLAWRSNWRRIGLLACGLAVLFAYLAWDDLRSHFAWLYLLQQVGAYALLGISFGRSLGQARVPLCTHFATLVHGPLSAAATRYTRAVTVAWTVFFAGMSSTLLLLYMVVPLAAWSVFANFCTAPLVALMFVGEYVVRHRVLPDMRHASIIDTIRAVSRGAGAASITVPHA